MEPNGVPRTDSLFMKSWQIIELALKISGEKMEHLKNDVGLTDCPCGEKNEFESLPYTIHKNNPR